MTEIILFLDVDGVLNNPMSESDFSDFNLGNFKNLVEKLSPKVVISSDWRRYPSRLEQLRIKLLSIGVEIFDTTICSNGERKNEIKEWLVSHTWNLAVIIDDMAAKKADPKINNCYFRQVNYRLGLTEDDVDDIVDTLHKLTKGQENDKSE